MQVRVEIRGLGVGAGDGLADACPRFSLHCLPRALRGRGMNRKTQESWKGLSRASPSVEHENCASGEASYVAIL